MEKKRRDIKSFIRKDRRKGGRGDGETESDCDLR